MSVRPARKGVPTKQQMAAIAASHDVDQIQTVDVSENANGFSTVDPNHPLHRKVVVGIRATLADLTMNSGAASWTPSAAQLEAIFKQRKFTGIDGKTDMVGDLRTVVLHQVDAGHTKSTFPVALGASITGVDKVFYSSTGKAHSLVTPPHVDTSASTVLQQDDVTIGRRSHCPSLHALFSWYVRLRSLLCIVVCRSLRLRHSVQPVTRVSGSLALLPPLPSIRHVSKDIAVAVARKAQEQGNAPKTTPEELRAKIEEKFWDPAYDD